MRLWYLFLAILLPIGLVLISYGAYYIQIGETKNGTMMFFSGMVPLWVFNFAFVYTVWKNWYNWERKIAKKIVFIYSIIIIVAVIIFVTHLLLSKASPSA